MVYGWMPTVLELYIANPERDLAEAARLTKAKNDGDLTDAEVVYLANVVNRSLVGASKLLHFVAPDKYGIWDSKIYRFVFWRKPSSLSG